jgi:hypothetical protein
MSKREPSVLLDDIRTSIEKIANGYREHRPQDRS